MPALFERDGDALVPTGLTRGGWADDTQHGGPPCGVMARAIEAVDTVSQMQTVRITFDLFRAIPIEPLATRVFVVRSGRRIQVVDVELEASRVVVARASALRIRVQHDELPPQTADLDRLVPGHGPHDGTPVGDRWFRQDDPLERFYVDAIEARTIDDSFVAPRPGRTWFRLRVPLVGGEEPTPLVRLACLADMANGNAAVLDPQTWTFINPDLTLYVHRMPAGEWIGMDSHPHLNASGIGIADTLVYDEDAAIGRIVQAQLVGRHTRS